LAGVLIFKWRVAATGGGNSGGGFSAIGRRNLKPAAEGRTAGTRMADTPVAVTWHRQKNVRS
jgi:hypothetical protein